MKKLAQIVLQNIEFFDLAPDSDVNSDVAVQQLESIAYHLKQLSETELECFLGEARKRLEELQRSGAPEERLSLLKNLREDLGL